MEHLKRSEESQAKITDTLEKNSNFSVIFGKESRSRRDALFY